MRVEEEDDNEQTEHMSSEKEASSPRRYGKGDGLFFLSFFLRLS